MMHSNSSVIITLCSHICSDNCKPLEPSEWTVLADRLIAQKKEPADILSFSDDDFKAVLGYSGADIERIKTLLDRSGNLSLKLQEYEAMGIHIVTRADAGYPRALKKQLKGSCPPLFYYAGDVSLTANTFVGFVGSRNVNQEDCEFTATAVKKINGHGFGLVSGGARGVDTISAQTSLANGNICIEYISDSLAQKIKNKETFSAIQNGRLLILSVAKPDAGFNTGIAMMRNRYIYAQSAGTVVVKSDYKKGGTWSGASNALKKQLCPVFCRNYPAYQGNMELIKMGAIPIDESWNGDVTKTDGTPVQLSLFD